MGGSVIALLGGWRATTFAALAVAALFWGGSQWSAKQLARTELSGIKTAQAMEREAIAKQHAESLSRLSGLFNDTVKWYGEQLEDAEDKRKAVVADLNSARLQLRREWTCPVPTPGVASDPRTVDEDSRLRTEGAAAFVQDGAEADAWIVSLQKLLIQERKENERLRSRQK